MLQKVDVKEPALSATRRALCIALIALLTACATSLPPVDSGNTAPEAQPQGPAPTEPELRAHRSAFVEPPGVLLDDVTQATISTTICVSGWTATVRPSTSYTQGVKRRMLLQAGLDPSEALKYELDHFVPLAVGGHPRSIDNLWLQKWDGQWSARVKDRLERTLQVMVCAGKISLHAARTAIQNGWKDAYKKFVGSNPAARGMGIEEEEVVE